jgi:hypothetical protein
VALLAAAATLPAQASNDYRVRPAAPPRFDGQVALFCQQAQYLLTGTRVSAANRVHGDYDAFVLSKPQINPLTTQQLVRDLDAPDGGPRMISCKLKTVDNLVAEYGSDAARGEGRCGDIHRQMVIELAAALPTSLEVEVDDDLVVDIHAAEGTALGPQWLKPHQLAYRDSDGRLHIRAKEFRVDWNEPRFAAAPPQFRGIHYCHLIAPDYLRRLATGELQAPAAD